MNAWQSFPVNCALAISQGAPGSQPAGLLARLSLGAALRSTGELVWAAADVASGEVGRSGRLVLASGRQQGGLDTGLVPIIMLLHQRSAAAGTASYVSRGGLLTCKHAPTAHCFCAAGMGRGRLMRHGNNQGIISIPSSLA